MRRAPTHGWCSAAALALTVGTTTFAMGAATAAGTEAGRACEPATIAVSFGSTGLDASHVDAYLVFTNTSSTACTLDGYPTVHYVTKGGAAIGSPSRPAVAAHEPVLLEKGRSAHSLLRSSVPGVWPPTACKATRDFGIRVTPPGSAHASVLHFPESVCSGTAVHEATTAPVRGGPGPLPGACTAMQLADSLGRAQRAAGTVFVPIVFTNTTLYTCAMRGHPEVTSVNGAAQTRVGPAATDDAGPSKRVWIPPFGGTASALLGVVETSNFPASTCRPRSASALQVVAPHTSAPTVLAYAHTVCTHLPSTHVSAVVAGTLG